MEILKCNLYIVGSAGVGKTFFRRSLEEFIYSNSKTSMDRFKGPDWLIRTEDVHIEVEIKESRSFDLRYLKFASKETQNIILYITDNYENRMEFSIPPKDIKLLSVLSKKATIIIATTFRPYDVHKNINF